MRLAIEIGSLRLYTPLARARFCRVFLSKGAHAKFCAISTTRPPTRSVPATLSEFSLAPSKPNPKFANGSHGRSSARLKNFDVRVARKPH
jgi:hypothetical protein